MAGVAAPGVGEMGVDVPDVSFKCA